MTPSGKDTIKRILGNIPFTAELYYLVRQRGKPLRTRFSLRNLQANLPEINRQAAELRQTAPSGKKIFIFATLHYWIEHAALVGMALAAQGHKVTFGYLPYADWQNDINRFDLRRQNAYARKVLEEARPLMESVSFISVRAPYTPLPADVAAAVQEVSTYDAQYTLQMEEIDPQSEIYKLRFNRNREIAQGVLAYLRQNRPDVVIVPNGTIQELGVVYRVARHLKLPVVTYEFSDQRQRIWLAYNSEVMRQDTAKLWEASKDQPLREDQLERMRSLMMARQRAAMWENFARLWQGKPAEGGEQARRKLGLDERPVVLLATNVLGDSLTLGRQVFSKSMAEWISRTVQYFIGRPDVQLVIRIHPGEVLTHGQSMADVVQQVLPRLPENIRLIRASDEINTYDLIEVADVGLVYTTTVGLEMAMMGLPVVVAGQTHYRERGFTYDPDSWVTYFKLLGHILENPAEYRLSREQVNLAWQYAYRFFFDYPQPFPWHLVRLWEDYRNTDLKTALTGSESEGYRRSFRFLAGEPVNWDYIKNNGGKS
ncbi:MAG: hypothetical protein KatS3mg045_1582 [Bellilinea sp.]|nr:MAG: hypothetical protein KatS3mg045_1582 [Bellilinea sp.]